jgi:spore maturation protein CgeB
MRVMFYAIDDGRFPAFSFQCIEALKSLGHEVRLENFRKHKMHKTPFTNRILNKRLFSKAEKYSPDLLLVNKGANILPGYIEKLSDKGIKTANWTLDEPFGIVNKSNRIGNIAEYDYFFVFDPFYLQELRNVNLNSFYLPCTADPVNVHKEMIPLKKRKYKHDLSFVGSHDKKREDLLNGMTSYDIKVSGHRWDKVSSGIRKKVDPKVYSGHEMCREFNESRININIHALHSVESVNNRTFEIPAANSFQVCDYYKEIANLFDIGKEIVCYRDLGELKELADYYLDKANLEERNKITIAGHERVLKEHTVRHRIEKILEHVRR